MLRLMENFQKKFFLKAVKFHTAIHHLEYPRKKKKDNKKSIISMPYYAQSTERIARILPGLRAYKAWKCPYISGKVWWKQYKIQLNQLEFEKVIRFRNIPAVQKHSDQHMNYKFSTYTIIAAFAEEKRQKLSLFPFIHFYFWYFFEPLFLCFS